MRRWRPSVASKAAIALAIAAGSLYVVPLGTKEAELRRPNVAKSPDGRHYAQLVDDGTVRVDRLPCGNAFTPPPAIDATGMIRSILWRDSGTLAVGVAHGVKIKVNQGRLGNIKVVVSEGD